MPASASQTRITNASSRPPWPEAAAARNNWCAADAIGSVAHYLAAFGWEQGVPTHFQIEQLPESEALRTLLAPDTVHPSAQGHEVIADLLTDVDVGTVIASR